MELERQLSLAPDSYRFAPLADRIYGLLNAEACTGLEGWVFFNSEDLNAEGLFDSLEFKRKSSYLSPLARRISEALLLENLMEVFGPAGLSTDDIDGYKQNWKYQLVHVSNLAALEFHEYKGVPKVNFAGVGALIEDAVKAINFLIRRQIHIPLDEAKYRQMLSPGFLLRQVDTEILKNYDELWRHDDEDAVEKIKIMHQEAWFVQSYRQTPTESTKLVTWSHTRMAIDFIRVNERLPNHEDDFNTRISPHLLLLRLLLVFGPSFWRCDGIAWGMTLKHETGCWLQICNKKGYLILRYEGPEEADKTTNEMLSYLISQDVITPYDGNIAGRVA